MLNWLFPETPINKSDKQKLFKYVKENKQSKIAEYFKKSMVHPDRFTDKYGNTLLHIAFDYSLPETAVKLLEHGANVNTLNELGATPLDFMLRKRDKYMLTWYINYVKNKFTASKKIKELEDNIVTLENKISEYAIEISKHKNTNLNLNDNNKRLRDQNDELEQKNKKLRLSVDELRDDVNRYIESAKK